ncbi:MAG TPA: polyhydroxyalkanoic acid system family protein [Thermoanaerobaculia bacterium]|nr:polyhydroxyalkanoic acid system family protein [Thermoanaerobaculia bacterium]
MRMAIEHHTTRAKAKKIVEQKLRQAEKQYGQYASDFDWEWHGDTLHVSGKAKGMKLQGTVEITETELIVDGKLPLLAKPFESRIRHAVEREAEEIFRTA